ncbi:ABC transporter permease [Pelotomaculum propionicicum]|uniref:Riboflavin transport system permease protein RibX n=1 Tax=Pelotomaculum propionicicum TaxID=258475 RepID=A0A4Y7RTB2_9FIRM|nr:ABC transporter permease [Pelotomaculum propionicicum]NLI13030.1 ABC transporter permease [Peptococcaceae bacterium]TEB11922.1 Riboflavin transport system permease protein RibX [Pelotomaculum propionicicum]
MKKYINTADRIVPVVFILILLVLWEYLVKLKSIPDWILPGPLQIVRTLAENAPLIARHAQSTLLECLAGFIVAIVFSFVVAFLMDEIALFKNAVYPLIVASQTIPIISVAPLFIIWFGYGMLPKIIVVVLVCFFPIAISLLGGLAAVDSDYLELFRSMQAKRLHVFRMVKLPLAMPAFFSGLRISAAYSVMGAVIGEWLGAKQGLGTYMTLSQRSFQVDRVFAAILAVTVLSAALFALVSFIERIVIPWNRFTEK